jgi:hypothetical protein
LKAQGQLKGVPLFSESSASEHIEPRFSVGLALVTSVDVEMFPTAEIIMELSKYFSQEIEIPTDPYSRKLSPSQRLSTDFMRAMGPCFVFSATD